MLLYPSLVTQLFLQFNVDDEDAHPVKYYKNWHFWRAVASILTTELLLISALIMVVRFRHYKVIWFEWWRWLFFFSGRGLLLKHRNCFVADCFTASDSQHLQ